VTVLSLILIVLLIAFVLAVLLAGWTLWFQGYIYTEPTTGILWRAPAAGGALLLLLTLWVALDYRAPGRYRTLFDFDAPWESKQYPQMEVYTGKTKETFRLGKDSQGVAVYRNANPNARPQLPSRPDRIVVKEDDKETVYEPERDARGKFAPRPNVGLRYNEQGGSRYMVEGHLGRVETFYTSRLLLNLLLNGLHFAVWFAVLWLLLRFAWPMALVQAGVFWLVMTLFVLPPLLTQAETVARQRAVEKAEK
jgi:hypothetical protein